MVDDNKNDFPLEKVLTVSAQEYVDSHETRLSNYELIGVHHHEQMGNIESRVTEGIFAGIVPKGTEVVTDLRFMYNPGFSIYISGTALIPKHNLQSTEQIGQ